MSVVEGRSSLQSPAAIQKALDLVGIGISYKTINPQMLSPSSLSYLPTSIVVGEKCTFQTTR